MHGLGWLRPFVALTTAAVFFLPLYIALVNVFKPSVEIVGSPLALPLSPTLDNIAGVLTRPDGLFWRGLLTSVTLTASSIIITTLLSAMLAHYLVRSGSVWGRVLLSTMLVGLMIPPAVIMVPLTRILSGIGLMNSIPGAVLVNVGYYLPFAVLVFMGFVRSIPKELEEAAEMDGASRLRIFFQIVFPLLRPASASVLIFLGRVDLERLPDPAAHSGPRHRQHDHRRHLPLDRHLPTRLRLGLRLHVPGDASGARFLSPLPEALHPRPDRRRDQGLTEYLRTGIADDD